MLDLIYTIVITGFVVGLTLYAIRLTDRIRALEDDYDRVFEAFQLGAKPNPGKHLRNGAPDA